MPYISALWLWYFDFPTCLHILLCCILRIIRVYPSRIFVYYPSIWSITNPSIILCEHVKRTLDRILICINRSIPIVIAQSHQILGAKSLRASLWRGPSKEIDVQLHLDRWFPVWNTHIPPRPGANLEIERIGNGSFVLSPGPCIYPRELNIEGEIREDTRITSPEGKVMYQISSLSNENAGWFGVHWNKERQLGRTWQMNEGHTLDGLCKEYGVRKLHYSVPDSSYTFLLPSIANSTKLRNKL